MTSFSRKRHRHLVTAFVVTTTIGYFVVQLCSSSELRNQRHHHHDHQDYRHHLDIKLVLLAPSDLFHPFSVQVAKPAVEIALRRLQRGVLPPHRFHVRYGDSRCSELHGMNEAIKFYMEGQVHVFLGPVCDYSVAPVARQATFWKVPVVSVGAVSMDFLDRRKQIYPLLTRAGPVNLRLLLALFLDLMRLNGWHKAKLLYQRFESTDVLPPFCHMASEFLVRYRPSNIDIRYFKLSEDVNSLAAEKILLEEVGKQFSG